MKVSELTIEIVANYIRVEVTTASKTILDMVLHIQAYQKKH